MAQTRRWLPYAKIACAAGMIWYLITSGRLSLSHIHVAEHFLTDMITSVCLFIALLLLATIRWHIMLQAIGKPLRWMSAFRINAIGIFCNTFMPGGFGGDLVRLILAARENNSRTASAATIFFERALGMLGLLFIGGGSILFLTDSISETPSLQVGAVTIFGLLGGIAIGCVLAAMAILFGRLFPLGLLLALTAGQTYFTTRMDVGASPMFELHSAIVGILTLGLLCVLVVPSLLPGRRLSLFIQNHLPLGRRIMAFIDHLLAFRTMGKPLALAFFLSVLIQAFSIAGMWYFARAIGHAATMAQIALAAPLAFIANIVPLVPGGLGVGESVFDGLLSLFHTPAGKAMAGGATIFLGWRTIQNLVGVIFGLPLYLLHRQEVDRIRDDVAAGIDPTNDPALIGTDTLRMEMLTAEQNPSPCTPSPEVERPCIRASPSES